MIWLKNRFLQIGALLILLLILIGELGFLSYLNTKKEKDENITDLAVQENTLKEGKDESQNQLVAVEIKGQVQNPGIYKLDANATINDALKLAGNITAKGFVDNINLSQKVVEQMVIYIFAQDEYSKVKSNLSYAICYIKSFDISNCLKNGYSVIVTSQDEEETIFSSLEENANKSSSGKNSQIVNLNTADKDTLMTLSGIGEAKALSIIEYRKTNGGFKTIAEIKNVKGIGEAIYAKIKNYLKV